VLTIGFGVGSAAAVFSLFSQVVMRNLGVLHQEDLWVLHLDGKIPGQTVRDTAESVFSYPLYSSLREVSNPMLNGLIARSSSIAGLARGGNSDRVRAELVSGDFFQVLGVPPFAGRLFAAGDDVAGNNVAVVAYSYWAEHHNEPNLVGSSVLLNGHPVVVIGVAPPGFRSLIAGQSPDIYVPLSMYEIVNPQAQHGALADVKWQFLTLIARTRPSIDAPRATTALNTKFIPILRDQLASRGLNINNYRPVPALSLRPIAEGLNVLEQTWKQPLLILLGVAAGLLLIACSSLSSLFLARGSQRHLEIAIRQSVGASRWLVIRELHTESLVLALIGGVAAIGISAGLSQALLHLLPADSTGGWVAAAPNWRVLGFCLLVSLAVGSIVSIMPALQVSKHDVASILRGQGRSIVAAAGEGRSRRLLVTFQIAVSAVLIIAAGLFAKSLNKLLGHDPGFRPQQLITLTLEPALAGYDNARGLNLYSRLVDQLVALPNVSSVSYSQFGPFGNYSSSTNVAVDGYQPAPHENMNCSNNLIGPGYFSTLGVPIEQGREVTSGDTRTTQKVAVVNQAFVKRFISGKNAIGVKITIPREPSDIVIVGVVRDMQQYSLREKARPGYYLPFTQFSAPNNPAARAAFVIRTSSDASYLLANLRSVVRSLDQAVMITNLDRLPVLIQRSAYEERALSALTSATAILALALAGLGLYGVVSYEMTRRTPEIGVRMALGAGYSSILRLGLVDLLWTAGGGAAFGLIGAFVFTRVLSSQLYGVASTDPFIYTVAAAVLFLVALIAAAVPLRRALRITPLQAIHNK